MSGATLQSTLVALAAGSAFALAIGCSEDPAREQAPPLPKPDAASGGVAGAAGGSGGGPGFGGAAASGGSSGSAGSAGTAGTAGAAAAPDASGGSSGGAAMVPADVLDLANWKLTLPVGQGSSPIEVTQPELRRFSQSPYFVLNGARDGVVFHAHAGGVTTSNSGYPRSELREMTNRGADNAAWSTTSGVHTMTVTQAITHLPVAKPHVVAGQIHDASDDLVMIRLEGTHLFVEGGGDELGDLDASYQLGARFTIRVRAAGGMVSIYYQDLTAPKVTVAREATGCYFKAGAYTQSNPSRGDEPTAYGEVAIYALSVTHE